MKPDIAFAEKLWVKYENTASGSTRISSILDDLSAMPPAQAQSVFTGLKQFGRLRRKEITKELTEANRSLADGDRKMAFLNDQIDEYKGLKDWFKLKHSIERPNASCLHHARQALVEGSAFIMGDKALDVQARELRDYNDALDASNCFVVEHDWASAFEGATDFAGGDIRLPYELCAFDFKIGGRRVVALTINAPDSSDVLMQLMVRGKNLWMIDDDICRHTNGSWTPIATGRSRERNLFQELTDYVGSQIRAITIALDAQVAETETIRVSEKLARSRERSGHVPPKPYHVVSLARRARSAPLAGHGDGEHGKKRLHFRRGHWRHFEAHKTWIRWMLVGNPDLGFVDKEYRL